MWKKTKRKLADLIRSASFTEVGVALDYSANWQTREDEFDFDSDWFCWTVGLGLRLDIEQFPIRLDFGVPVVEVDDDNDKQCFSFTIGYDF